MFAASYADVFKGDERWRNLPTPSGNTFEWDDASTYVRKAPYFDGMPADPEPVTDIKGARVLALLGDSVTTDHISPAGSIKKGTPPRSTWKPTESSPDFNSLGSRRGKPRGDDPRHIRQHQAAQPAARRCFRRRHPRLHPAGRTAGVHLRCRRKTMRHRTFRWSCSVARSTAPGSSRDWAARAPAARRGR